MIHYRVRNGKRETQMELKWSERISTNNVVMQSKCTHKQIFFSFYIKTASKSSNNLYEIQSKKLLKKKNWDNFFNGKSLPYEFLKTVHNILGIFESILKLLKKKIFFLTKEIFQLFKIMANIKFDLSIFFFF